MSRESDAARLSRILELIDDASMIARRHGSVRRALEDKEGEYAIYMVVSQIGECLGKIETPEYASRLPVREATGLRNVIVHEYEGVSRKRIEVLFETSLPALRKTILALMKQ